MIELTSGCIHHYRISRVIIRPPFMSCDLVEILILLTSQTKGLHDYTMQSLVNVTLDRRVLIKIYPASKGPFKLSELAKTEMQNKIKDFTSALVRILF